MIKFKKFDVNSPYYDLINKGLKQLNQSQIEILKECLKRCSAGLSLPMGSGKTIISLVLSLIQSDGKPILVVCSKSLIPNWEYEIKKFFKDSLVYTLLHHNNLDEYTRTNEHILLTTPEVLSKCYKKHKISLKFLNEVVVQVNGWDNLQNTLVSYNSPKNPYLTIKKGTSYLYSTTFGCYIIDEAQKFTKVTTIRCRALSSICSKHRWLLSGTMFDEPVPERILGYHIMLDHPTFPRTLPDAISFIRTNQFKGLDETLVKRTQNIEYIPPKVNKVILSHELTKEEAQLYLTLKETLKILKQQIRILKINNDKDGVKKFTSYMLAMITYLRQFIVIPLLPVTNIALDIYDYKNNSELSVILNDQFKNLGIDSWLNDKNSVKSSRISKVIETLNNHKNEKVVLFTCFRTSIDMIKYYIPKDRTIHVLESTNSIKKRGEIITQFQNTEDESSILLLSYELGAEGLNLQCSHTVLIVDFWWNIGKTNQAIARILRYGQKSDVVNIYFFTSNTGIEKALFKKQLDKKIILDELSKGSQKSNIQKVNMDEVLRLIESNENKDIIKTINNMNNLKI